MGEGSGALCRPKWSYESLASFFFFFLILSKLFEGIDPLV